MFANSGDWLTSMASSFSFTELTKDSRWVLFVCCTAYNGWTIWKIGDYIEALYSQWDNAICIAIGIRDLSLKHSF